MQTLLELPYKDKDDGVFKIVGSAKAKGVKYPIEFENCVPEIQFTMKDVDQIIDALLKFRMRNPY